MPVAVCVRMNVCACVQEVCCSMHMKRLGSDNSSTHYLTQMDELDVVGRLVNLLSPSARAADKLFIDILHVDLKCVYSLEERFNLHCHVRVRVWAA
jgi:hypothetical protein